MDELQNQQNQQMPQEPQAKENFINKKKIIIAIIIALLIIGFGIWYIFIFGPRETPFMPSPVRSRPSPETGLIYPTQSPKDTTSAIDNDLNSINVESIDDSFKEIDADLNNL